jgi:hypothetical protein
MTWKPATELPPPEQREHGSVILANYGHSKIPTVLVWRSAGNFSGWSGADGHTHIEPMWWMPAPPAPTDDRPLCAYCAGSGRLAHRQLLMAGSLQEHWKELPPHACDFCGGSGRSVRRP